MIRDKHWDYTQRPGKVGLPISAPWTVAGFTALEKQNNSEIVSLEGKWLSR